MATAGLAVAAASFAGFRGLQRGLGRLPAPRLADARARWSWSNICASLVHSLLAAAGALLWMAHYAPLVTDFTLSCPPKTVPLVSLSIGYFLADGVDILRNQTFGQAWQLLCHHAMSRYPEAPQSQSHPPGIPRTPPLGNTQEPARALPIFVRSKNDPKRTSEHFLSSLHPKQVCACRAQSDENLTTH